MPQVLHPWPWASWPGRCHGLRPGGLRSSRSGGWGVGYTGKRSAKNWSGTTPRGKVWTCTWSPSFTATRPMERAARTKVSLPPASIRDQSAAHPRRCWLLGAPPTSTLRTGERYQDVATACGNSRSSATRRGTNHWYSPGHAARNACGGNVSGIRPKPSAARGR